jgi:hypothetical protein
MAVTDAPDGFSVVGDANAFVQQMPSPITFTIAVKIREPRCRDPIKRPKLRNTKILASSQLQDPSGQLSPCTWVSQEQLHQQSPFTPGAGWSTQNAVSQAKAMATQFETSTIWGL